MSARSAARTGGLDLSVHLVTDERVTFDRLLEIVDAAVDAGIPVVQLRDKTASTRALLERALAMSALIAGRARFVLNDRVDVALAARSAGARIDGVHLGQSDLPPVYARALLGADALIGWSAQTPAQLRAAADLPTGTLDYLGVGAVRATATKPDHPTPLGVAGFRVTAAATALPCVAIGGVGAADADALMRPGEGAAAGLAVVSAVCQATDPARAARELVAATRECVAA